MSVRQSNSSEVEQAVAQPAQAAATTFGEAAAETALAEGNSYNVASPDRPLTRTVVVSIKSTLNDLCLQRQRGTWSPSAEALRGIFQNRRFTDLSGAAESQGDLSSIVLHSMKLKHSRSSFPIALGVKATGVDDATYSSTGDAYSTILLPESESARERELQSDDVSLGKRSSDCNPHRYAAGFFVCLVPSSMPCFGMTTFLFASSFCLVHDVCSLRVREEIRTNTLIEEYSTLQFHIYPNAYPLTSSLFSRVCLYSPVTRPPIFRRRAFTVRFRHGFQNLTKPPSPTPNSHLLSIPGLQCRRGCSASLRPRGG